MAQITAQMVKDLREMTGAGMMDCKSALGETAGDINAAVDWLRKKGLSKAAKKADRVAAEGLIGVAVKGTKGVVVEVNSETDFVARNDLFQGLVKMIANVALDGISRSQGSMGVDLGAAEKPIIEDLPKPEEKGLGFEALPGPRGVADDLKKLTGVSPAIEKKLNDLGIFHYTQIAELSADAAHNVGEEVGLPGRVQGWVAKAKELTAE